MKRLKKVTALSGILIVNSLNTFVTPAFAVDADTLAKVKALHCSQPQNKKDAFCADFKKSEKKESTNKKSDEKTIAPPTPVVVPVETKPTVPPVDPVVSTAPVTPQETSAQPGAIKEEVVKKDVVYNDPEYGQVVETDKVVIKTSAKYEGPKSSLSEAQQKDLFNQLCVWDGNLNQMPTPNYVNSSVKSAAHILSQVESNDFYFYPVIRKFYDAAAKSGPEEYSRNAKLFLTQLCGEFRDRPGMIQDKINWVNRMTRLADEEQQPINYAELLDGKVSIWQKLSGRSYNTYLKISDELFEMRTQKAKRDRPTLQTMRKVLGVTAEAPIKPNTICETKYLIGEFVAKNQHLPSDLDAYEVGYNKFSMNPNHCSQEDLSYVYNFRGDANFKHYSPEANAMIWHALSIARFCESPTKSNGIDPDITDEVCANYFSKPFLNRYNAARSGLAAWLVYARDYKADFEDQYTPAIMLPKFQKHTGQLPYPMQVSGDKVIETKIELNDSTLTFNLMFGIGDEVSSPKELSVAFDRLKAAVNRHTNWYKSGYHNLVEPQPGVAALEKPDQKDQAYSPFVASSYEMSKSNTFAECGYTVKCPNPEQRKAWMFVFKVHKKNWYNTNSLLDDRPLDFDRYWLDETSFGTDRLADEERAFDRLGTAVEGEFSDILYLRNLRAGPAVSGGGVPVSNVLIKPVVQ